MKKSILILGSSIAVLFLSSFVYNQLNIEQDDKAEPYPGMSCRPPQDGHEFVMKIESRFARTVSLETIQDASNIMDLLPKDDYKSVRSFRNINISTFSENRWEEYGFTSENDILNQDQKELLSQLDYTESFHVSGDIYFERNGKIQKDTLVYYMSVAPENPAKFIDGEEDLLDQLRNTIDPLLANIELNRFDPGKIEFTITKDGSIQDIRMVFSCGVKEIDEKILQLFELMEGKWEPATNALGENVEQQLTFFYGAFGC